MMDAKTSIEILRSEGVDYFPKIPGVQPISKFRAKEIADFIEQQEKYAELGRLVVSTHICWCEFDDQECKNTPECPQRNFCQKRAELLGGGQYMDDQQIKVDKIYEFVRKWEDFYYDKIGDDQNKNMLITFQATSYQRVRCFIENMMEDEKNGQ